jgi:hypothetical protein
MRIISSIAFVAVVSLALAAGIAAALRLARLKTPGVMALPTPAIVPINYAVAHPSQNAGQSTSLLRGSGSQANVLELSKASTDFIGYWGGYIHSSMQRFNPDLFGTSPERVSVVFGRRGDTIFIASELYSSPTQKIVQLPKITIARPKIVVLKYESADDKLYYICQHRFRLNGSSLISYESRIDVYDLSSHRLAGIITQHAMLKRLLTLRDQLQFSRPSRLEVPRAQVSASARVAEP